MAGTCHYVVLGTCCCICDGKLQLYCSGSFAVYWYFIANFIFL